jgi:hypothetical protein
MAKNDLSLFSYQVRLRSTPIPQFKVTQINPDSSVESNTAIKRQALRSEDYGSATCSGLQSPVPAVKSWKIASPGPRTLDGVEIVRSVSSLLRAHLLIATQVPISTAESGIKRQAAGALLYVLRIQDISTVTATRKTTSGIIVTHGG